MNLNGKVALITGASRGIGLAAARALAAQGARVILVARSAEALHAATHAVEQAGGDALAVPCDVRDAGQVAELRQAVLEWAGPPSILVNAAGVFGPIAAVKDGDPAAWVDTLAINTVAPYLLMRAFLGDMFPLGWGRIVNVTSAASLDPPGGHNSAYATSKTALNMLTRHVAAELAGTGITANVIHPGDVKTEMWADIRDQVSSLGPETQGYKEWVQMVAETGGDPPEKAAALIVRICSPEMDGVTGQFLWIEGGLRPPIASW